MSDPKAALEDLLSRARIVETPCGDGSLVWQQWGKMTDKPPLVLLHGGYGSWTHWMANVESLSEDRLVVTCDTPGLGDSAVAPGDVTPDNIARPIADGLDAAIGAGNRFDLAGFSFGGLIGARVAAMVGDRCRTFVPVGASGFAGLHVRVLGIEVPAPDMTEEQKDQIHVSNLNILMLHDPVRIDPMAIHTHKLNVSRARVRSRPMSLGNHLVDALPGVSARVAGIWGVHDATGGGREAILDRQGILRQFQADAEIAIIEDAGHWVMYERPAEFNATLCSILDGGT